MAIKNRSTRCPLCRETVRCSSRTSKLHDHPDPKTGEQCDASGIRATSAVMLAARKLEQPKA